MLKTTIYMMPATVVITNSIRGLTNELQIQTQFIRELGCVHDTDFEGKTTPFDSIDLKIDAPQLLLLFPKQDLVNQVPNLVDCVLTFNNCFRHASPPPPLLQVSSNYFMGLVGIVFGTRTSMHYLPQSQSSALFSFIWLCSVVLSLLKTIELDASGQRLFLTWSSLYQSSAKINWVETKSSCQQRYVSPDRPHPVRESKLKSLLARPVAWSAWYRRTKLCTQHISRL